MSVQVPSACAKATKTPRRASAASRPSVPGSSRTRAPESNRGRIVVTAISRSSRAKAASLASCPCCCARTTLLDKGLKREAMAVTIDRAQLKCRPNDLRNDSLSVAAASTFHHLLIGLSQETGGLFEQVSELLDVLLKMLGVWRIEQPTFR